MRRVKNKYKLVAAINREIADNEEFIAMSQASNRRLRRFRETIKSRNGLKLANKMYERLEDDLIDDLPWEVARVFNPYM